MLKNILVRGANLIGANDGGTDMCGYTKLWVDDERPLPKEYDDEGCWQSSRTPYEAMTKMELLEFTVLDIDHDMGCFLGHKEITGYDVLLWLVDRKQQGLYVPPVIRIHTSNPCGWENMNSVVERYLKDDNIQKFRR